jgi:hypothetical protein
MVRQLWECCAALFPRRSRLGEVARQERIRKQTEQTIPRIYTNRDLPRGSTGSAQSESQLQPAAKPREVLRRTETPGAPELLANIRKQKQTIQQLEAGIKKIRRRLGARPGVGDVTVAQEVVIQNLAFSGPCPAYASYNPYEDWCKVGVRLTADLEKKEAELKKARAVLEDSQERARHMGYGSFFYDPQ